MKVLEAGRRNKAWIAEMRCSGNWNGGRGCDALLLIEPGDLFISKHHTRPKDVCATFRCSACGANTDIAVSSALKGTLPLGVDHKDGGWTHPTDNEGRAVKLVDGR